jgi:hypothetical protein
MKLLVGITSTVTALATSLPTTAHTIISTEQPECRGNSATEGCILGVIPQKRI